VGLSRIELKSAIEESARPAHGSLPFCFSKSDAVVFSDNGNSFFEDSQRVLEALGFGKHRCYPANVHQSISVNDNPLHGTSKEAWRASGVDDSDDLESCLSLLSHLNRDFMKYCNNW